MRAYRMLLRLYPSSFRDEYGAEMRAIFARRHRDATTAGAVAALWTRTIADTLIDAAGIHADILRQDLRHTRRTLARMPGFAATVILVAALGIGATTASVTMADHVLVRPLPFAAPERLVKLYQSYPGYARTELSAANYADWKRMSTSFEEMAAYHSMSVNLVGQSEPVRLDGAAVTTDLFHVLGAHAMLGRVFASSDDRPDAPAAVLLSYDLWATAFGSDPAAVGRTITLVPSSPSRATDRSHTIVGVMPRSFRFPQRTAAFWIARRWVPGDFEDRDDHYIYAVARLKPDVSIEQARAELGAVAATLERQYPEDNARSGATVIGLRDEVTPQTRMLLLALVGAAVCMLLIACTNLASLLLTRALVRQRELAVRAAVGAGWHRLVRQMLTESLVLAALGGAGGMLLAVLTTPLIARLVPTALPIGETPGVDWRLLSVAAVATIVTGVGFGLIPALRLSRGTGFDALREGARTGGSRRTDRMRSALVVAEVAASAVLLISAGLLIRALWQVQGTDPGFRSERVLTLRTALPMPPYGETERRQQLYGRILSEVRALPGVTDAGYISFLPLRMRGGIWAVTAKGDSADPTQKRAASLRFVTPGFFAAMGIPIRLGRDVTDSDTLRAPHVAVVSESLARELWPGQNPLGRQITLGTNDKTVVGVAGDVRVRGLERPSEPQVYLASGQVPDNNITGYVPKDLIIKAASSPMTLMPAVRDIVKRADPQLPISDVQMLGEIVDGETAPRRAQVGVLGALATVAIVLASIGIHGLLAFSVSARRREIGVRLALGAAPGTILARVLGQGVVLGLIGLAIGVPVALAAGRLMQALLAGVSPADPATVAGVMALCMAMAVAGSLAPALHVLRIDPLAAIRED